MKKATAILGLVAILGIGCYASYSMGWSAGESHGWFQGDKACNENPTTPSTSSGKHHYELKEHGRETILRLDTDTGDLCWVALSEADVLNINQDVSKCP